MMALSACIAKAQNEGLVCMGETMIVRLAEIEVFPQYLTEYLSYANEVDRLSVEREPGVVCLYPMQVCLH